MKKSLTYAVVGMLASAMVALPANSSAQIRAQGNKQLFRIDWKKGQTFKYRMKNYIVIPGMAQNDPMMMDYSLNVKDVKSGRATVEIKGSGAGASNQTETVTMDTRGRTSSQSAASMLSNEMNAFPEQALAVGESWKTTGSAPGMAGQMKIDATNTFVGFKTVDGKRMAHIAVKMNLSGSGMTGTGTGDLLYEVSNGMNYRSTIKMTMNASNPQNNQKMEIRVTTQVNRL